MPTKTKNIPHHIGIIVDGNRRWAKEMGLPALEGHRRGYEKIKEVADWCRKEGVKILTVFCFSTENWNRSESEINYLMRLAKAVFLRGMKEFHKKSIKIRVIGQKERLPKFLQKAIKEAEDLTKDNGGMVLNFAISYGGRAEIIEAMKNIIKKKILPEKITEEIIRDNLWTSDVDLIIRTGKEQRISNFLIWQAAYSELHFCKKYWPGFTEKDFKKAIFDYSRRKRRFGK